MLKKSITAIPGVISIFLMIIFSVVSLSASGNSSGTQKTIDCEIVKFSISPASLKMYPGGSMQLIAVAYDSNGKKIEITPEWKIKSDISSLGEFDKSEGARVIFSALNSGTGSIIAVFNDIEAEVHVKIFESKRKKK
ncbi:MAG: hypothetical protein CVV49_09090 [Spirochaetae bacterium HGW-Spirochaetae-5]|nr:MAG: hypothetical protein CVV49_09090 [Spirochaetae bacterium HGW-Spirochaetae-5]